MINISSFSFAGEAQRKGHYGGNTPSNPPDEFQLETIIYDFHTLLRVCVYITDFDTVCRCVVDIRTKYMLNNDPVS